MENSTTRPIIRRQRSHPSQDGDGVAIKRLHDFGGGMDPFLMLDELMAQPDDQAIGGFPPHPHRGIQTLTFVLHGGLRHEDHMGHHSSIGAGGAQWMHTGRGIIHGETPFTDDEGLHAFQLWLNLPARDKLSEPTYRDIEASDMPSWHDETMTLTALGGTWQRPGQPPLEGPLNALAGQSGVAHLRMEANASLTLNNSATTLLAFVFEGRLNTETETLAQGELVTFGPGHILRLTAEERSQVLLLSGEPHGEPIAHYGPFVMNHQHELEKALRDYRDGTLANSPG